MRNTAKLAFDMLEKEMDLIPFDETFEIMGGIMITYPWGASPLPNGYCVFNGLSWAMYGNTDHAQEFFNDFKSNFPDSVNYNADGSVSGVDMNPTGWNYLNSLDPTKGANSVSSNSDFDHAIWNGSKVYGTIGTNTDPNNPYHVVILQSRDGDKYGYYDPTNDQYGEYDAAANGNYLDYTYSVSSYAYTEDPNTPTTTAHPYTTTGYPAYTTTY